MNTTLLVSCVVRRLYWKRMSHEEPRGAPPLHRVSFRPQSQTKHFNDSVYGIERQLSLPRQVTVQAGRVDLRALAIAYGVRASVLILIRNWLFRSIP